MEKTLYVECSSGVSGDMLAAALLDVGADEAAVRRALASLPVEGFEVRITRVEKSGLDACDFAVVLDAAHENHDHDMGYLYGTCHAGADSHAGVDGHAPEHDHAGAHDHGHAHGYMHDCGYAHEHVDHERGLDVQGGQDGGGHERGDGRVCAFEPAHEHAHGCEHRGMCEISALIDAADMTEGAKNVARRIFSILAEAEAKAHGVSVDEVHFHEVGAVDSIADVVAIAVAFDSLRVDKVIVTELAEGTGVVRCQHGIIPVPVPAVVNIVAEHGIPVRMCAVRGELVTPTGAAAVAALRTAHALPERFSIERVGTGAGKRAYPTAGVVRAMIIEPVG